MAATFPEDLRTPKEVSRLLRVTPATVRRWLRTGQLKGYHVGGRWRVSHADAREMVREARRA